MAYAPITAVFRCSCGFEGSLSAAGGHRHGWRKRPECRGGLHPVEGLTAGEMRARYNPGAVALSKPTAGHTESELRAMYQQRVALSKPVTLDMIERLHVMCERILDLACELDTLYRDMRDMRKGDK